ncbi:unnamed protein product [Rhizoctonia solani]|uniref:Laminin domain protein n=1 Tax=Rhizoctonia solani TaxID=456999 RepID=A0A8H2XJ51_9AGAM|nr:unnamed protein product [Rhizoctonia solani]
MPSSSGNQVHSPPQLPLYLKKVYDLKPIVGVPSDEEVIGIHAVIRVANKVVDVEDMGDPTLLARLSEHLFSVQLARYRSKRAAVDTAYTPPSLPAHVSIQPGPVKGTPSEEDIIRAQSALRAYQQFSNIPSMFDPRVDMELSQRLFDIQMANHTQRTRQSRDTFAGQEISNSSPSGGIGQAKISDAGTNNAETRAGFIGSDRYTRKVDNDSIHDAIERSNLLAEQANQLVERSNQLVAHSNHLIERSNIITERTNELLERSSQRPDKSSQFAEKFNEPIEKLNSNSEKANQLAEASTKPTERLEKVLMKINKVLVGIQHAIVRNHKGNKMHALDCLVNEYGETPGVSWTTGRWDFASLLDKFSGSDFSPIPILIDGVAQDFRFPDILLAKFLHFYGIGDELCEEGSVPKLKRGKENHARERLRTYWASCLG